MADPAPRNLESADSTHQAAEIALPKQVLSDLPCPGCGYNLRGLDPRENCPECGTPVRAAFFGEALAMADPHWLAQLERGGRWLRWSGKAFLSGTLLGMSLQSFIPHSPYSILLLVSCILVFFSTVGLWFVTTPDPAEGGRAERGRMRRVARATLIVCPAGTLAALGAWQAGWASWIVTGVAVLFSPAGLSGLTLFVSLSRHFEQLARRAGDEFSTKRARFYQAGFIICWIVFALVFPTSSGPRGGVLLWVLPGAGMVGFAAMICAVPTYLENRLRECAAAARRLRIAPDEVLGVSAHPGP